MDIPSEPIETKFQIVHIFLASVSPIFQKLVNDFTHGLIRPLSMMYGIKFCSVDKGTVAFKRMTGLGLFSASNIDIDAPRGQIAHSTLVGPCIGIDQRKNFLLTCREPTGNRLGFGLRL